MSSFCTNCAESLEPGTKFCGACGTAVETTPVPTTAAPILKTPSSRVRGNRYPALRIIATLLKVFAVLTVIGALLSAFPVASLPSSVGVGSAGSAIAFLVVIVGLCYGLFLWASAEMIQVLIDIEENTRRGPA